MAGDLLPLLCSNESTAAAVAIVFEQSLSLPHVVVTRADEVAWGQSLVGDTSRTTECLDLSAPIGRSIGNKWRTETLLRCSCEQDNRVPVSVDVAC